MSEAAELHREVGELKGTVTALSGEVSKLREQVEMLTAILNQGKGAKWLLILLPSLVGVAGALLGYFGVKLTVGH
jgi:hypothetical protein